MASPKEPLLLKVPKWLSDLWLKSPQGTVVGDLDLQGNTLQLSTNNSEKRPGSLGVTRRKSPELFAFDWPQDKFEDPEKGKFCNGTEIIRKKMHVAAARDLALTLPDCVRVSFKLPEEAEDETDVIFKKDGEMVERQGWATIRKVQAAGDIQIRGMIPEVLQVRADLQNNVYKHMLQTRAEDGAMTSGTRSQHEHTIRSIEKSPEKEIIKGMGTELHITQFLFEEDKTPNADEVALAVEKALKQSTDGCTLSQLLDALPRACTLTAVRDGLVASAECRISSAGEKKFFASPGLREGWPHLNRKTQVPDAAAGESRPKRRRSSDAL